jgi:hypothetical protein
MPTTRTSYSSLSFSTWADGPLLPLVSIFPLSSRLPGNHQRTTDTQEPLQVCSPPSHVVPHIGNTRLSPGIHLAAISDCPQCARYQGLATVKSGSDIPLPELQTLSCNGPKGRHLSPTLPTMPALISLHSLPFSKCCQCLHGSCHKCSPLHGKSLPPLPAG